LNVYVYDQVKLRENWWNYKEIFTENKYVKQKVKKGGGGGGNSIYEELHCTSLFIIIEK